ncbi:hypothetical protein GCM10027059_19460 [Myceligenerans halotolerans]
MSDPSDDAERWCALWVRGKDGTRSRMCDLPAGADLPLGYLEQAVTSAGFGFARTILRGRAAWQHVTAADRARHLELEIHVFRALPSLAPSDGPVTGPHPPARQPAS